MKEISIEFEPSGDFQVSVKGVDGPECKLLTAPIEDALGVPTATKQTSEYRKSAVQTRKAVR